MEKPFLFLFIKSVFVMAAILFVAMSCLVVFFILWEHTLIAVGYVASLSAMFLAVAASRRFT